MQICHVLVVWMLCLLLIPPLQGKPGRGVGLQGGVAKGTKMGQFQWERLHWLGLILFKGCHEGVESQLAGGSDWGGTSCCLYHQKEGVTENKY